MTQQTKPERIPIGFDGNEINQILRSQGVSIETSMHMVASEAIRRELELVGNMLNQLNETLGKIACLLDCHL